MFSSRNFAHWIMCEKWQWDSELFRYIFSTSATALNGSGENKNRRADFTMHKFISLCSLFGSQNRNYKYRDSVFIVILFTELPTFLFTMPSTMNMNKLQVCWSASFMDI